MHGFESIQAEGRSPRRRFPRSRLLAGAAALAMTALLPAGVSAQDSDSPCPFPGTLCLFEGEDFTGEVFMVQALDPQQGTCVNLPEHGWEGRANSAINTNGITASLFFNEDCDGGPHPIDPHTSVSSLGFHPKSVWVY
ncbi:peptidase inhibitor family I36 protein [Corallococcus sp. BB11-1]|nr:peptidase inhibitor family I36 protein [Corallococcus sp. BB11-1]MCY1032476.1 peptidase inhibitor family I36 protein [Corallococcus sp. BB11-1]